MKIFYDLRTNEDAPFKSKIFSTNKGYKFFLKNYVFLQEGPMHRRRSGLDYRPRQELVICSTLLLCIKELKQKRFLRTIGNNLLRDRNIDSGHHVIRAGITGNITSSFLFKRIATKESYERSEMMEDSLIGEFYENYVYFHNIIPS